MPRFASYRGRLQLGIPGLTFADLHRPEGLRALHERFCEELRERDPRAHAQLEAWRRDGDAIGPRAVSAAIVSIAPHVGAFVARLFDVEAEVLERGRAVREEEPVFAFRKLVAKKRVLAPEARSAWTAPIELAHLVARRAAAALGS